MRRPIAWSTIVSLILAGCKTPTNERVFLTRAAAEPPVTKNVRYAGQYRLYTNAPHNPTTQKATPIFETRLAKGDLVGFELSETGQLRAVFRTDRKPLPNSSAAYTWTLQADPGQFDPDRTLALVVVVLFVAGVSMGILAWTNRPFK